MMSALSWFKGKTERQLISYQCPCIAAHDSDKCAIWSPETMSFHPQMWQVSEQISSSLSSTSERLCAAHTHTHVSCRYFQFDNTCLFSVLYLNRS